MLWAAGLAEGTLTLTPALTPGDGESSLAGGWQEVGDSL